LDELRVCNDSRAETHLDVTICDDTPIFSWMLETSVALLAESWYTGRYSWKAWKSFEKDAAQKPCI